MSDAVALGSDFKIYNEELQTGIMEGVAQALDGFNAASRNAMRLITESLKGQYVKEAFFKPSASDFTRRDTTSFDSIDLIKPSSDEFIGVKVDKKFGPYGFTRDSVSKIQMSSREMSRLLGVRYAERKLENQLNSALIAVEAALEGTSDLVYDATGESTKTMIFSHLLNGRKKLGDRSGRIVCWVMHSTPYHDLMINSTADSATAFQVGNLIVNTGTIQTLGLPVIVTDSSALTDANGSATDTYNTLGLVADAVVCTDSENDIVDSDKDLTREQITYIVRGECSFNLAVKGFKWDITNGGANPTDATLGTSSNWDQAATSVKDLAGVRIVTQ